jgi:hypothetical protein
MGANGSARRDERRRACFARRHIPQPKAVLAENAAFLALVWWAAVNDE